MRAIYVFLFWAAAAAVVVITRGLLPLQIAAILTAGFAYIHLSARQATLQHAFGVGVAWASLSIAAEIVMHFTLITPATHGAVRDLLLLAWIAAPPLFARHHSEIVTRA
jgi:hypothetical protein